MLQFVGIARVYCKTSFRSSKDRFSTCRNIFQLFISKTLAHVGEIIGINPVISPKFRRTHSRQQLSSTKCEEYLSARSLSKDDLIQPSLISEEALSPATYMMINREDDMDDWGHFMDFQDNEYLAKNMMPDPFQSLTKHRLRQRGVKNPVEKLEEVHEVDSFNRKSE